MQIGKQAKTHSREKLDGVVSRKTGNADTAECEALIQSQQPELAAAIRAGAQAKAAQLKAQLAGQVANILTSQLNRSLSFYDDWFDPLIGVRGRLNLSKAFYLTAETDVGGSGSDLI